jgi:hypothetical protein
MKRPLHTTHYTLHTTHQYGQINMKPLSQFSIVGILGAVIAILCVVLAQPRSRLEAIMGADYGENCQYILEDWENPSRACWPPFGDFEDGCSYKKCVGSVEPGECGSEKKYSMLYKASYIPMAYNSSIAFRQHSNACYGVTSCVGFGSDPTKSCYPQSLESPPSGAMGCDTPPVETQATGCQSCMAGMVDPLSVESWVWYETVGDCPH